MQSRAWDKFFIAVYAMFTVTSATIDPITTFGLLQHESFAKFFAPYTQFDPMFGAAPLHVRVLTGLSLFAFLPLNICMVVGLLKRASWLARLGLFFAGMQIGDMIIYFAFELFGDLPPTSWPVVLAANLPYLIIPAMFAVRCWKSADTPRLRY